MFFIVSKLVERFLVPSNFVLIVGLLGVVLMLMRWRRIGSGLCVTSILLTLVGGLTPLGDMVLSPLENRFPPPALTAPPTGIIMLGGAVNIHISRTRNVVALNDAAERVTTTAALALRFPQARIFLSGGAGELGYAGNITESELAKRLLIKLGIPADRISMEEKSRNTAENAAESFKALKPKPDDNWLLVTSANHMPRAVGCFRAAGFQVTAYPVDYRTVGKDANLTFPKSVAIGFRHLDVAVHEWIGLVAYRLAGKSSALFPAP